MTEHTEKQLILIVDDTPENIDVLADILRPEYEIKASTNGKKAIKIAAANPRPDMVLLDVMMPGLNGYEVCRRLKADPQTCDIPVIFVTATRDATGEKRGFELGAIDYLTRPVSPPTVLARVKTHLQLHDQNIALEEKVRQRTAELESSRLQLIRNERFLDAIVENIPNMLFVKDAKELRFVRLNKAGEELIGFSREELIGKNDYDFFPRKEADFFTRKDREVLTSRGLKDIPEEPIQTRNKGERRLHTKKIPILDENGQPEYLLGISEDITDKKRLEQQLRQTQKMESIGNLAGGIAHDFNNILFPIIGLSEMLLEDLTHDSLEYENAQEILTAGKRGSDLVKQILAFSRQSEHIMKPVRIQQVLKEVLKLTRSTIPSDIKISNDIQPDCRLVMANPVQMHQIAMNLITNAYHAVEETSGEIAVKLTEITIDRKDSTGISLEPGGYSMLSICDTGCGISPEVMDKIFEPYFTTKKQGKGTGLGLAVVYGIVKEHKGDIEVYSEIGKGTTFNVYIPLMERVSEKAPVKQEKILETGNERILLVDDEEAIVRLEKQMLERLGYHVSSCISSADALDTFRSNPDTFDLVITDMTMPNMTGDQLAKELISIRSDIPVIICTGFSERINKEKAKAIGIKSFLMKPVIKSEMAKIVRKVIDEKNHFRQ